MDWFKDFYEKDYFHYRYAPRLEEIPTAEVEFILRHGLPEGLRPAGKTARVLDICCGIGRHARPLAAAGCEVVGVDLSGPNIAAAGELAARDEIDSRCRFVQGDIRTFDPPTNCDLAINIFTSFGYFEDEQADAVIFRRAVEALRPGGRFILDVANREKIVAGAPTVERRGSEDNYVIDESAVDLRTSRQHCTWTFVRNGHSSRHEISIRLYSLHELIALGESLELDFVAAYGDFEDSEFTPASRRCITVFARR